MNLTKKYGQHGFTVQEMLLVILISLVLLAVSVVGIITYMRYLQLAQLDNSAKEIFLAAQNRAILLRSSQQLNGLVVDGTNSIENVEVIPNSDGGIQITVYYIHCESSHMAQLLPDGTIDPTLWDGDFWITYEPESGSVIDVFYSDQNLGVAAGTFPDFYREWRTASKLDRMNRKPMVGYYGGESAESGTTISLRTPVINIYNEDTLRVEVTYWVPRTLHTMGEADNVELDVTLTYQEQSLALDGMADNVERDYEEEVSYLIYTYTWTLDSLKEDEKQFKELFSGLTYGDDFTVSAEVSYAGDTLKVNGARKIASDNSLFAKDSDGDTAIITCLRHLQNLDADWSNVDAEKTKAVQKKDIQGVEGYEFRPIENTALNRYDGGTFSIYDLNIIGTGASAGMFGNLSGEAGARKTLKNIRLVNTKVTANDNPAGALVGSGSHLTIDNCQVYWENRSEETTNLRDVLGDSATQFKYQITGSGPAGGLAGTLTNSDITNCSASSLARSTGPVGGLVGEGSGLEINLSYAASYLDGPAAAGLVGDLAGSAHIYGSYAVGFIDSGEVVAKAAGLCLGSGTAAVESSYSAMLFTAAETVTNYPLCETGNDYKKTYYLDSEDFNFQGNDDQGVSYGNLIDSTQWDDLFGSNVFTSKRILQSHPYNLQTTLSLNTYIYPGLEKLDHWGDWGAQFQNGSLVYYEVYKEEDGTYSYGFQISGLSDDKAVVEDGYAVAYESTQQISRIGATLTVNYQTANNSTTEGTFNYGGGKEDHPIYEIVNVGDTNEETNYYYLLPLPEEVVSSDYASPDFYQKITIDDTPTGEGIMDAGNQTYYYSPHFANTVLTDEEIKEDELSAKAAQLRVEVRTPRHLYNLSKFEDYYASNNQYRFLQQRDLDYDTYKGYYRFTELFTGNWSQTPIGLSAVSPFRCVYYGNCHSITGVVPTVQDDEGNTYQHVGLFGYSTGVLQDIVYQMRDTDVLSVTQSGSSSQTLYVGALAGFNGGTVDNCASYGVRLQANGYQYSTIYLGGLVGQNQGAVQSSAVEGASITAQASMSHAYAGGFVGENTAGGVIDHCYAVGKVSVSQARYGTVYACGFAGRSSATLSRSYAVVYLLADGEAQRYGFCPDYSRSCVYLNNGNFTYRGENYAARYTDSYAASVSWDALTGQSQSDIVDGLGMEWGAASNWKATYPYPAVVTEKEGTSTRSVHYGQWPEQMDLGPVGVYYWEKLTIDKTDSYHFSAIFQTADGQVSKSGTLSTSHGDGGVVTEYGYGYFYEAGSIAPSLSSDGIGFQKDSGFSFSTAEQNQDANQALSTLMGDRYSFHSYNTWGTAAEDSGLYTSAAGNYGQPPCGAWTLNETFTVRLNPFFADSMSYDGWTASEEVPTTLPGTEKNPYRVRSIDQLQFINWNSSAMSAARRMDTYNKTLFPYLCYGEGNSWTLRQFYWEQTHDLEGETGKTYTPIAAVYDPDYTEQEGGNLFGWFGGTYDGNDYMIAEVSIASASSATDDATSCVGLFGAVYNGTLQNIVLYSEKGASVTGNNSGTSQWYVIGGLAGLAGSSTGSAVVNCTVSGYTISDQHSSNATRTGWGGTGVGGLIGICDMDLVGCTAVTELEIDSKNQDNVRIGGLVGSCQGSISSCYTGGSIKITSSTSTPADNGIYVGGIVGGIYMKPLQVTGSGGNTVGDRADKAGGTPYLNNTLSNCYTYLEIPRASSNTKIKGIYAVGGPGELNPPGTNDGVWDHGSTSYDNNYYLDSVVLKNNSGELDGKRHDLNSVTPITYSVMADSTTDNGLLHRLNSNIKDESAQFSTVTTQTASGEPLNGRYSFGSDSSLLGRDYPFPTILTQSSDLVAGGKASVHYGDWPLAGIRRENGGLPVNLDLFADYKTEDEGAVCLEELSLEGVDTGGTWSVDTTSESYDPDIATAALSVTAGETNTLSITGRQTGSTVVTVTYTVDGEPPYTLDIAVNVTAELRLAATAASPVQIFTNETVQTALELRNRDGKSLPDTLENLIELSISTVEFDPDYFATASIDPDNLILTADSGTNPGNTQITVGYDFTYLEKNYHATSAVNLELVTPEIELTPLVITFDETAAATSEMTVSYNGTESKIEPDAGTGTCAGGQFTLKVDGEALVSDVKIIAFEMDDNYKSTILADWATTEDGIDQIGTLSIEAYYPTLGEAYASVRVQFQFEYGGSTHLVWKDLPVQIKIETTEEGGAGTETEEGQT